MNKRKCDDDDDDGWLRCRSSRMLVSRLVLQYILTACWLFVNAIYRLIQMIYWMLNGSGSDRPDNSARLMRIVFRFKFDQYLTPASVNDFILTHERFVDPEYVLQDHISLYQVSALKSYH